MLGENELIERILRALPSGRLPRAAGKTRGLRLGIGDDAAILRPSPGVDWVLSCDEFLEGVHFLTSEHPPDSVGYKALARATSDLAAMGATPRFFLLGLALPPRRTGAWLDRMLGGMARAAKALGMTLAGGDTSRDEKVSLHMTVLGEVAAGRAILRSGALPGDQIFVSGVLGRAQLGLDLLLHRLAGRRGYQRLLRPHLYPQPRVALGRWLARRGIASAMIDLSDGLSTDLTHLCEASGVGARLWAERIPRVTVPPALLARRLQPERLALHGGEDYELLFTVPPRRATMLRRVPPKVALTCIGQITPGRSILLVNGLGRESKLPAKGWDPFRH